MRNVFCFLGSVLGLLITVVLSLSSLLGFSAILVFPLVVAIVLRVEVNGVSRGLFSVAWQHRICVVIALACLVFLIWQRDWLLLGLALSFAASSRFFYTRLTDGILGIYRK